MSNRNTDTNQTKRNVSRAAEIFAEYGTYMWRVIRLKVFDRDCHEELYQSFFLLLVSKQIPGNVRNMKGYLFRMLNNYINDWGRKKQRDEAIMKKYITHFNYSINNPSSRNVIDNRTRSEKVLRTAKRQLSSKEYAALSLRFEQGKDAVTIARMMNVKEMTASRYISVAIKKMRRVFEIESGK